MRKSSKSLNSANTVCDIRGNSKIRDFWNRQIYKCKKGSFTCPFCKEAFTGLAAFGAHLKDHCT